MKNWIEQLPFEDPVLQKQAALFQAFLFSIILALSAAMLLNIVFLGADALTLRDLGPNSLFLVFTFVILAVVRSGRFELSVTLFIVALLIAMAHMVFSDGLSQHLGSLVAFFLPITLAGLLVGRPTMLLTLVATLLIILLQLEAEKDTTDSIEVARSLTIFVIVLTLFSFVLDRFGITLRHALVTAQHREEALRYEIEKSHRTEIRLAILQDITAALSTAITQYEVAEVIVSKGLVLLGGQVATVCLITPDRTQLEVVSKRAFRMRFWLSIGFSAWIPPPRWRTRSGSRRQSGLIPVGSTCDAIHSLPKTCSTMAAMAPPSSRWKSMLKSSVA